MKTVFINKDHAYPIYAYSDKEALANGMITSSNEEIHVLLTNAGSMGICKKVVCRNCPIEYECDEYKPLYNFFPELKESNPELFI